MKLTHPLSLLRACFFFAGFPLFLSVGVLRGVEFDGPCRVRRVGRGDLPDGYSVHPVRSAAERDVPVLGGKFGWVTPTRTQERSPIPSSRSRAFQSRHINDLYDLQICSIRCNVGR